MKNERKYEIKNGLIKIIGGAVIAGAALLGSYERAHGQDDHGASLFWALEQIGKERMNNAPEVQQRSSAADFTESMRELKNDAKEKTRMDKLVEAAKEMQPKITINNGGSSGGSENASTREDYRERLGNIASGILKLSGTNREIIKEGRYQEAYDNAKIGLEVIEEAQPYMKEWIKDGGEGKITGLLYSDYQELFSRMKTNFAGQKQTLEGNLGAGKPADENAGYKANLENLSINLRKNEDEIMSIMRLDETNKFARATQCYNNCFDLISESEKNLKIWKESGAEGQVLSFNYEGFKRYTELRKGVLLFYQEYIQGSPEEREKMKEEPMYQIVILGKRQKSE